MVRKNANLVSWNLGKYDVWINLVVVNVPAFNQCILVWDRVGTKKRSVSVYRRVDVIYVVKKVIHLAILTKSDQGCLKFSNIV